MSPSTAAAAPAGRTSTRRRGGPWPVVAAAIALVLLATRQAGSVPGTFGLSWVKLAIAACALLWAATRLAGQRSRRDEHTRVTLGLVCAYVAVSFLSYGAALGGGRVAEVDVAHANAYLAVELLLIGWVGFLLTTLRTLSHVRLLVQGLTVGATISASAGLAGLLLEIDLGSALQLPFVRGAEPVRAGTLLRAGMTRPQGAAGHPLELATISACVTPLALSLYDEARARGRRHATPWLLCAGVLATAAVLGLSRSALVALVLAYAVLAWRYPLRRVATHLALAGAGTVVLALLRPGFVSAVGGIFASVDDDPSVRSRAYGLDLAADLIGARPLLGQGFGATTGATPVLLDNGYLGRLVETGLVGLLSFLAVLAWAMREAALARRDLAAGSTRRQRAAARLPAGLLAALVSLSFSTLFLDVGGFPQVWLLLWTLVAACGAVGASARAARRGDAPAPVVRPTPTPAPEDA